MMSSTTAEMQNQQVIHDDSDFYFTYTEEPHKSRRMKIIQAHPEVTKLNGPEPLTKYVVLLVVLLQFTCAYLLRDSSFRSWKFWATAYFIGGTCDNNIFLAVHELSHNLAFKKPLFNRLFGIFTNFPIGIPYSAGFGPYHLLHHKHMGEREYDTDLPTPLEAAAFSSVGGKIFFTLFQLFFYALRPIFLVKLDFTWVHYLNIVTQIIVDYIVIKNWGWFSFYYLLISVFLSGSLHPIAAHFIAEHYVLDAPKVYNPYSIELPETYSYYGPLNIFVYNAGYHNEHHDFPYIPWTRIKKLREIAAEFYDPLPYHTSWSRVFYDFIFDDKVSLWCRILRKKDNTRKSQRADAKI